jgi:hypothetical protein
MKDYIEVCRAMYADSCRRFGLHCKANDLEDLAIYVEENIGRLRISDFRRDRTRVAFPLCDDGARRVREIADALREFASVVRAGELP